MVPGSVLADEQLGRNPGVGKPVREQHCHPDFLFGEPVLLPENARQALQIAAWYLAAVDRASRDRETARSACRPPTGHCVTNQVTTGLDP
jgi:hypothetical protein